MEDDKWMPESGCWRMGDEWVEGSGLRRTQSAFQSRDCESGPTTTQGAATRFFFARNKVSSRVPPGWRVMEQLLGSGKCTASRKRGGV